MGAMRNISGLTYIKPKLMRKTLIINWAKGHIIDDDTLVTAISTYKYSVVGANNETSKAVKEGKKLLLPSPEVASNAAIGNSDVASTVYVSTSEGTAYSDDYVSLDLYQLNSKN